ncbi:MAG: FAD-dependent oxidoreductase [Candidatus Methanofastidiosa archaeon]|nr:FAD-dependent oxidoreductase [Candidatus Methanofastidiosa archaeon]
MRIFTNTEVIEVIDKGGSVTVIARERTSGKIMELSSKKIMIAGGRVPNSDILKVENTGIKRNERGYIQVNQYLETSKENIWAFGDIIGKYMFRHIANKEAAYAWHNSIHEKKIPMDYNAVPHAVFSYPEIASVGMTEKEAKKEHKILIGIAKYNSVAKGIAMLEDEAFAKAVVERDSKKILGFHIIGPHASILIQEVINAMANNMDFRAIYKGIHIHPALTELIPSTFGNLMEPEEQ